MFDLRIVAVGIVCIAAGVLLMVNPDRMLQLSHDLNRKIATIDRTLIRHRFIFGTLLCLVGVLFFRIAHQVKLLGL